jgi:putative ABC transport system ATP-binding protein
MSPRVSLREVTKTYTHGAAGVRALHGITLDIFGGEVVLLMGPSGSGKTTLILLMGCMLRPTSGSVWLHGREVSALTEGELAGVRRKHIGFVFQSFNLFSTLTTAQNVELVLELKGIKGRAARSRARELLDQVGLDEKCDVFPANLSGGQKQRVAIARALAGEPGVILADEPTAALDWQSGRNAMTLIRGLAGRHGCAVVVVTHDSRVQEFADRIVHIEDGRIQRTGALARPGIVRAV